VRGVAMAMVKITDSSGREREVEISSTPKVFGRSEDSDYVLGSRAVARHHLKIWEEDGCLMVEDISEGVGVRVDGEPIAGIFAWPEGKDLEVGAFLFSQPGQADLLEEGPDESEGPAPVPILEGLGRGTKGLEIELQLGINSVGRDPSSYIAIDDPSISRQHAQIVFEKHQFHLVDMHSSNGTFVNNKRTASVYLRSGDVVRFGEMDFRFVFGEIVSKGAGLSPRKKLLLSLGLGVLLLFLFGLYAKYKANSEDQSKDAGPRVPELTPEEKAVEHIAAANDLLQQLKWEEADKEAAEAYNLYPISKEVQAIRKQVKQEMSNRAIYNEGNLNYDLNNRIEALEGYRRIPENSAYYPKVKYRIRELETSASTYHMDEGKAFFKAYRFREAQNHFALYLRVRPCDRAVYDRWVKKTEAALKRNQTPFTPVTYRCTDSAQEKLFTQKTVVGVDPRAALKEMYPDPKVFDAMELHFRGKAEIALNALRRVMAVSENASLIAKAKELERLVTIVRGKYSEGLASQLRGEVQQAMDQFQLALDTDLKLMPNAIQSFYHEDIGKRMAGMLYRQGLDEYSRKQWKKSFESFLKCLKVKPDDISCTKGLEELEELAEETLETAAVHEKRKDKRAFDEWDFVLQITRPESIPYKKAQQKLNEYERP
jgi:pSer/pThr/pTyr-binding forkhead associated (FHA) protein